jgi:hypothetical protein
MGSKIDNLFFDGESIYGINSIYEKMSKSLFLFCKNHLIANKDPKVSLR